MFKLWFERQPPSRNIQELEGFADVLEPSSGQERHLDRMADANAVIAGGRMQYDSTLFDRCPELRVVSRTGIGVDNIDVVAATRRGIAVCNAPNAPTSSTAELALALLLAVAKDLKNSDQSWRNGPVDAFGSYSGIELEGLHLGVIGFGRIGRRVARMAIAMGMQVTAYDPYIIGAHPHDQSIPFVKTLDELLVRSDVITLHLPLTPETHHLVNSHALAKLKPGAILINTARGGLVDEAALLSALKDGRICGAGLDVMDPEPPDPNNPLLRRDDVIVTPHIGGATSASRDRLWRAAIDQALQVLQHRRPPHLVNPEVWDVKFASSTDSVNETPPNLLNQKDA